MIYGLVAALGWGLADFGGAVAGRRVGAFATVVIGQGLSAAIMAVIFFGSGHAVAELAPIAGWVAFNGVVSAGAYVTHYEALKLGPMAVVSPVGATYALVGLALAVVILDERPGVAAFAGAGVTVVGVMLASTDLRKLRAGTHGVPPGLLWAVASATLFGISGFILGWASQRVGWVPALWASRTAQFVAIAVLASIWWRGFGRLGRNAGTGTAVAVGLADLLGVVMLSAGAERGFVSIVLVASAVFPLIAVALSIVFLHERPVTNQLVGAGVVVAGLVLLGLG